MKEKLKLNIVLGDAGPVKSLKDGTTEIDGVEPNFVTISPVIAAFRKMVREAAYDVCEMAPTTYLIARAHGARFKALPIALMRRFHHSGLVKRRDAGIDSPKDLEGKRVGVRAYSVTTGVWTRGILQNEYGVDLTKISWMVDDDEHVQALELPENVIHVDKGKSLRDMMTAGDIHAAFTANAGIGRLGAPESGWERADVDAAYPEVIHDWAEAEARWFLRTGVYPIHAVVVVKDSVLEQNPWLPESMLKAFETSKRHYLERLAAGDARDDADRRYIREMNIVGSDPLPYGLASSIPAIDMLAKYALQQRLIDRWTEREEFFVAA